MAVLVNKYIKMLTSYPGTKYIVYLLSVFEEIRRSTQKWSGADYKKKKKKKRILPIIPSTTHTDRYIVRRIFYGDLTPTAINFTSVQNKTFVDHRCKHHKTC